MEHNDFQRHTVIYKETLFAMNKDVVQIKISGVNVQRMHNEAARPETNYNSADLQRWSFLIFLSEFGSSISFFLTMTMTMKVILLPWII